MDIDLSFVQEELKRALKITPSFSSGALNSRESIWRFDEFPRPEGFSISLYEQFGVLRSKLQIDSFGSSLRSAISQVTEARWKEIAWASRKFLELGIEFEYFVDEKPFDFIKSPEPVREFSLLGRFVQPSRPEKDAAFLIKVLTEIFADLVTAGIGWGDADFKLEGAKNTRATSYYERSPINRRLAIQIHGVTCAVCEFNFEKFYGQPGEGMVEIHHKTPVHLMEHEAVVDPRVDLVPLCSNCHTIAHKTDPPIEIAELKRLVSVAAGQDAPSKDI